MKSNLYKSTKLLLICLVPIFLYAGCSIYSEKLVAVDLSSIGEKILVEQQVQVVTKNQTIVMDNILTVSPEKIDLIGSLMGVKVFHMRYQNSAISMLGVNRLPWGVNQNLIFNDALYAFLPAEVLYSGLPEHSKIEENIGYRKIILSADEIIDVLYEGRRDKSGVAKISRSKSDVQVFINYVVER